MREYGSLHHHHQKTLLVPQLINTVLQLGDVILQLGDGILSGILQLGDAILQLGDAILQLGDGILQLADAIDLSSAVQIAVDLHVPIKLSGMRSAGAVDAHGKIVGVGTGVASGDTRITRGLRLADDRVEVLADAIDTAAVVTESPDCRNRGFWRRLQLRVR